MFGSTTYGMRPDILTCAKALSSGYMPISAVMVSEKVHAAIAANSGKIGTFGHMGHGPKPCRNGQRIDPVDLPPRAFVAAAMELPMVQPAKGDGEAVADLAPHRAVLGEPQMMGISRASPAH